MNSTDLLKTLSVKSDITVSEAKNHLNTLTELLQTYFVEGSGIAVPQFGTFNVKKKDKRKGFNPDSGKHVEIPEKRILAFSPSSRMKEEAK